jgi:hypothetical protein
MSTKPPLLTLPREHGFWVMLSAVVISGAGTSQWQVRGIVVALLSALCALVVAAIIHKVIRRAEWAQLMASMALALLIAPAELAAGMPIAQVAANVAAWAGLFTGSSLAVRAAFARSSRRQERGHAPLLSALSILCPSSVALALYLLSEGSALRVALVASAGMVVVAVWRPTAKKLKATGLTLALIVVLALLAELVPWLHM